MGPRRFRGLEALLTGWLLITVACGKSADTATDSDSETTTQSSISAVQSDDLILYTPTNSTQTYLVDAGNNPIFQWSSAYDAGQSAFLLSDGSILRAASINAIAPENRFVAAYHKSHNDIFQIGGIVERIAKDGSVAWTYQYYGDTYAPHHVATVLPNGNLLMPVWRYHSEDEAKALGRDPKHLTSGGLWIDSLIEVQPGSGGSGGQIVWEWHASDHLIQSFDKSKANYGDLAAHPERIDINYGKGENVPEDFMHVNSAFYIEDLDQIVVTLYHYSELWVIDHSTTTEEAKGSQGGKYGRGGDLLYRWGNPAAYGHTDYKGFQLSAVHDPKWLSQERHFILFDNNIADPTRGLHGGNSMLVEIAPPITAEGTYTLGEDGIYGPAQTVLAADLGIQASSVGTAERRPDGNFLSCNCPASQTIWVDASGAVIANTNIWQNTTKDSENTQVFRLVGYAKSDPGVLALGK